MKVSLYERAARNLIAKTTRAPRNHPVVVDVFACRFGLSRDHTKYLPTPNALPAVLAVLSHRIPNAIRERVTSLRGTGTIWMLSATPRVAGQQELGGKNIARFVRAVGAPAEPVSSSPEPIDPVYWLWIVPDPN